ncbi:hypothetical protein DPMN_137576 [Dreissena polymorpha]|uniref:Uncharacterized protein n=1 Tax=Dreissena polymorpha TaxID=45954 RepID=A0A9D4G230_DREPO|nr:hypothetical protein DPMN_137576 [Dreissena polymorpha]
MSFNADKFEVLRITRKRTPIQADYNIQWHQLALTKTGKYLGGAPASDLSWKPHVNSRTKSANNSLAFS